MFLPLKEPTRAIARSIRTNERLGYRTPVSQLCSPEDMYVIYKGFLLEDPVLEEAGIEDPTQLKEEFNQYGTVQLVSKDRSINITINKKARIPPRTSIT